jgi:[ribosomal protein S5]-alanine N-acetyltransferase
VLDTDRFHLRSLTVDDVTERYLDWLRDTADHIAVTSPRPVRELPELRDYVRERIDRDDVLFLGIFDKATGVHVGNIKFEPIDTRRKFAVMGILIGTPEYRGKGVAAEVLTASSAWLRDHRGINQIVLGVSVRNPGAIHAYEKVGFELAETPLIAKSHPDQVTMVLRL